MYRERREIIAELYYKTTSDINTAFEDFIRMHQEIKQEEALLSEKLDVRIRFDESAVDSIIRQAIEADREPGPFTFYLAKKLEYGLKLVRDRAGIDEFTISSDAITNMEEYINRLLKKYYREHFKTESKNLIQDKDA
jgi:ATP-dependent Clp protease ATP-binding subunit ClpX